MLQDYLNLCGEKKREFVLKRLPLWGQKVKADDVNFEWPTQEMLDKMPSDVYLQSLEFKSVSGHLLSSVRVCLSNG